MVVVARRRRRRRHAGNGAWVAMGPIRRGQNNRVDRRYSITLSAFAHNIFNVVNLAPPNGTLGGPPDGTTDSPFFGKSNQLATAFSPTAPRCGTSIFRRCLIFRRGVPTFSAV